jgi:hypothetical protein
MAEYLRCFHPEIGWKNDPYASDGRSAMHVA